MVRQLGNDPRAARSLALRRRLAVIWSLFAVVVLIGSTFWLSAGVSPVRADDASWWYERCVVGGQWQAWTSSDGLADHTVTGSPYGMEGTGWSWAVTGISSGGNGGYEAGGLTSAGGWTSRAQSGTIPVLAVGASFRFYPAGDWHGVSGQCVRITLTLTPSPLASPSPSPSPSPPCFGRPPAWFPGPVASLSICELPSPAPSVSAEACGELPPGLPFAYYSSRGYDPVVCSSSYVPALCFYYNDLAPGQAGGPWGNARQRVCDPGEAPGSYGWGWCYGPSPSGEPAPSVEPSPSGEWPAGRRPCAPGERPSWWSNGTGLTPAGQNVEYWPLSGASCVGGKPGYATLGVVVDVVFPGLTLDLGAYVEWVGQLLRWGVGTLQNVLTSLYDVAADLAVPCPATLGGSFGDFTDTFRGGPFGGVGSTADAVNGALAGGPGVPFQSFEVMGHTVELPLASVAGDAAPVRPYLVPVVWFAVALRALGMLSTTMKGPQPTGQLTFGM